jgi:uncharacterized protein GlcG (DUF336 family)
MSLSSEQALGLVGSALAHAAGRGLAVSVAVVDSGGFLKAFGRADGAQAYTADVALGKAYSVIYMGRSSAEVRELAEKRPQFFTAVHNLGLRTLIPSPGGVAIAGGAIGVSGAPNPDQDVEVASAAIAETGLAHDGEEHAT